MDTRNVNWACPVSVSEASRELQQELTAEAKAHGFDSWTAYMNHLDRRENEPGLRTHEESLQYMHDCAIAARSVA